MSNFYTSSIRCSATTDKHVSKHLQCQQALAGVTGSTWVMKSGLVLWEAPHQSKMDWFEFQLPGPPCPLPWGSRSSRIEGSEAAESQDPKHQEPVLLIITELLTTLCVSHLFRWNRHSQPRAGSSSQGQRLAKQECWVCSRYQSTLSLSPQVPSTMARSQRK